MKKITVFLRIITLWLIFASSLSSATITHAAASATPIELVFSGVQGTVSPQQTVTITNTGGANLQVLGASIQGTHIDSFTLLNPPGAAILLAPGQSTPFNVQFDPPAGTVGVRNAILRVVTDDGAVPNVDVALFGLSTMGQGGANEPPFQSVVNTLGFSLNVGGAGLILGTNPAPIGEEVIQQLFQRANPAQPVTLTPVARYSPREFLPYGFYIPNGTPNPPLSEVGRLSDTNAESQTLNPQIFSGGAPFNPGTEEFGIYVSSISFGRNSYTQDAINTGVPHATRVYPLRNRAGQLVPNSYLIGFEDAANGDYQDYVFVLSNVAPGIQDPPVAANDSATTPADTLVTFDIVGNDIDPDGTINAAITFVTTPPAAEGSVVSNGNGTVTFTPVTGFSGTSTFTYTVQDNEGATSNTATVQVTVNAAPPPPPPPPPPPAPTALPVVPTESQPVPVSNNPAPSLSVSLAANPASVSAGDSVTLTIIVNNSTGSTLNSLVSDSILPNELEILGVSSTSGSVSASGQTILLNQDSLGAGQSVTITVNVRVRAGSTTPIITVVGCAIGSGFAQACGQTAVFTVTSLPQTGESPAWRDGLMLFGALLTTYLLWRLTSLVAYQ